MAIGYFKIFPEEDPWPPLQVDGRVKEGREGTLLGRRDPLKGGER
jgi:hypothetical protein